MSSIPTKQIDGDASVSRNVTVGGKATVRGSATIEHNLIVKGWLDAPNVKGPLKGVFSSPEELENAYPEGEAGWWAAVGTTFPAAIYLYEYDHWSATGEMWSGPSIPMQSLHDSIEQLETSIGNISGKVETTKELLMPVECADEADLAAKAASDDYAVGQQFYIPESD